MGPSSPSPEALPVERAGLAFERADDPGRHPAAVEATRLRRRPLVADPGLVHETGVERDVVADRVVAGQRLRIRPRDVVDRPARLFERVVGRLALPLAEG